MKLHQLTKTRLRSKKRVGRGGKRGSYSGRGVKGQKSRAGRKMRPAERDLILHLPKLRGFRNKPKTNKPLILNLRALAPLLFDSGKEILHINKFSLEKAGFLPKGYRKDVKLLGDGEIKVPVVLEGINASKAATDKIKKAGGSIANNE